MMIPSNVSNNFLITCIYLSYDVPTMVLKSQWQSVFFIWLPIQGSGCKFSKEQIAFKNIVKYTNDDVRSLKIPCIIAL